jgi:hypothetical protein
MNEKRGVTLTSGRALAVAILAALTAAASGVRADASTLTAVKVPEAPTLDGNSADAAWQKAPATAVSMSGGANFSGGSTKGSLQAVYTADTLCVLLDYDDPTHSVRRSPYVKQEDGSWKKLKDPDDKGGDNNKYYEDKFALIWSINDSIKGFAQSGCMAACHAGEPGKPYGNKYTASEGELGDIWHMKTVRSGVVGQVDDQYLDHTRYDPEKAKEAGRKSDAKTGGGYKDIALVDGKPELMAKDARPANAGGSYFLKDQDKVPFDDSKFRPGDEVASILVAPFTGDRGEIASGMRHGDGKWTFEMCRKLVSGSPTDVQFDKLDAAYHFGLAAFDNAQVRHAFAPSPLKLVFQKSGR